MTQSPDARIIATVIKTLISEPPGVKYAHSAGPAYRLVIQKQHAEYEETRPLSPFFPSPALLNAFIRAEAPGLCTLIGQFAAEGFDHGSGARLPGPPMTTQTAAENTLHFADAYKQEALRAIRASARARVDFTVDLRPLELLDPDDGFTADLSVTQDQEDAYVLRAGPVRLIMTLEQTREVLMKTLVLWAGEERASVLLSVAERLPYEEHSPDFTRFVQAVWLAVSSVKDTWPSRTGGYNDDAWGVKTPDGVTAEKSGKGDFLGERLPGHRWKLGENLELRDLMVRLGLTPHGRKEAPPGNAKLNPKAGR